MKGQQGGWMWVADLDSNRSHAITVQVHHRTIFAEVALVMVHVGSVERHFSGICISQVVSDRGVETFPDDDVQTIYRTGVTSITFRVAAYASHTAGRWTINFWS